MGTAGSARVREGRGTGSANRGGGRSEGPDRLSSLSITARPTAGARLPPESRALVLRPTQARTPPVAGSRRGAELGGAPRAARMARESAWRASSSPSVAPANRHPASPTSDGGPPGWARSGAPTLRFGTRAPFPPAAPGPDDPVDFLHHPGSAISVTRQQTLATASTAVEKENGPPARTAGRCPRGLGRRGSPAPDGWSCCAKECDAAWPDGTDPRAP